MDIILKDVEVNTGYITFTCPVCGADAHVGAADASEVYWMIRSSSIQRDDYNPRFRDGRCKVCGCKQEIMEMDEKSAAREAAKEDD